MDSSQAQYHLRQVCVYTNMHRPNKPKVFAHALRHSFDEDGNLVDTRINQLISRVLKTPCKAAQGCAARKPNTQVFGFRSKPRACTAA